MVRHSKFSLKPRVHDFTTNRKLHFLKHLSCLLEFCDLLFFKSTSVPKIHPSENERGAQFKYITMLAGLQAPLEQSKFFHLTEMHVNG